ncbi:MAG: protein kinase [Planctomycetota bacterium]
MDPDRHEEISEIFTSARRLPLEDRSAFLDEACRADSRLREEVESLLAHAEAADSELDPESFQHQLDVMSAAILEEPIPLPETIGGYRILRRIAFGGMGAVYEAEQDRPRRRVALKTIRHDVLSPDLLRRFHHEADLLGRLQHPGIGQVFEAGTYDAGEGPQPFFAMEYLDGRPLTDSARDRQLSEADRLRLFIEVCEAVHHAHQKGIIHRDLKPENILVVSEAPGADGLGRPKILDFGVARLTSTDFLATSAHTRDGQIIGTLAYMSPEQVNGEYRELDTRSDVYSLGVVLYELLTGELPYELSRLSIAEAGRTVCEVEPRRPSQLAPTLKGDVETIVLKALDKEKHRRYDSAAALAQDIRHFLNEKPISAHPPSALYQLRKFARRNRPLVAGVLIAFVALVAALCLSIQFGLRESEQARIAERNRRAAQRSAAIALSRANRANLRAAMATLQSHLIEKSERYLAEIPDAFRNWEWNHVASRRDLRIASFETPASPSSSLTRPAHLSGIAFDSERGQIYWTDRIGAKIQRARFDGSGLEDVVRVGGDQLGAIAIDPRRQHLYWSISSEGSPAIIRRADLQGRHPETVVTATGKQVWALAVDPDTGRLYWSSAGIHNWRPGRSAETLAHVDAADDRWDVSLDLANRTVTWTDHRQVHVRPIAGDAPTKSWSPPSSPLAIAASNGEVVWSDFGTTHAIRRAANDGERARLLLRTNFIEPGALAIEPRSRAIYWADSWGNRMLRCDADGRRVDTIAGRHIAVAFTGATPIAASSFGNGVSLWNVQTGERMREISNDFQARFPSLSQNGDVLAVASDSPPKLHLFEASSGRRLAEWEHDIESLLDLQLSPAAELLAAGSLREIAMLDPRTGETVWRLPFEEPCTHYPMIFSRDGTRFATFLQGSEIHILDARTGEVIRQRTVNQNTSDTPLLAITPDGQHLAHVRDYVNARVVEASTLRDVANLSGQQRITQLAFSPGGRQLAVLSKKHTSSGLRLASEQSDLLELWDLEDQRLIRTSRLAPTQSPSVAFSPDGSRLAIADGASAQLVDLELRPVLEITGHASYVYYVAYSPDGSLLASASWNGSVRLWDPLTGEALAKLETGRPNPLDAGLGFTPDGRQVLFGELAWDVATGEPVTFEEPANAGAWKGFWRRARGGTRGHMSGNFAGENAASTFDGSQLWRLDRSGAITIRDLRSGQVRSIPGRGQHWSIAPSPDGALFLTGQDDSRVQVRTAEDGEHVAWLTGHQGLVYSINFSPDGSRIATASDDQTVILWDATTFEPVLELTGPREYVHSVTFSPDGSQIAGGCGDAIVYVWDSTPRSERFEQIRQARRVRERLALRVETLLEELADPASVAARLRADEELTESEHHAAERVLLRRVQR